MPKTKKKNSKLSKKEKKAKKEKNIKTIDDRKTEINTIKDKILNLGLSIEFEPIKLFYEECNKYIEEGIGRSGSVKLNGLKRILEYRLTTRKNLECLITLKYDENV